MTDVCGCPISRKGEFSNNKIEVDYVEIFKTRQNLMIAELQKYENTIHLYTRVAPASSQVIKLCFSSAAFLSIYSKCFPKLNAKSSASTFSELSTQTKMVLSISKNCWYWPGDNVPGQGQWLSAGVWCSSRIQRELRSVVITTNKRFDFFLIFL